MANTNSNLNRAKKEKNDEFYTQFCDVEKELVHYTKHFKNKVVLCNCDDARESNFVKYFVLNFKELGLKKLIATCYKKQNKELFASGEVEKAVYIEYIGCNDVVNEENYLSKLEIKELKGDGDFASKECKEFLKQADIVVTNPPFSKFREFIALLVEYEKKFLVLGNINAVTYKDFFPLIKENKVWLGITLHSGNREFRVPNDYPLTTQNSRIDKKGNRYVRVNGVRWFTNIEYNKSNYFNLTLSKKYSPNDYPKYDNYDAININKVSDIPCDYKGVMGVPITFVDKYNHKQFRIKGYIDRNGFALDSDIIPNPKGTFGTEIKGERKYGRILIKNRNPKI